MNVRRLLVLSLGLCAALLASPARADDAADILGEWQVLSGTFDGKGTVVTGRTMLFDRGSATFLLNGKPEGPVSKYTLRATATPKQIDLSLSAEGKPLVVYGIYELSGDRLRVCYSPPGSARPATFDSPAGAQLFLYDLQRGR